jgi:hypothetical protein
MRFIRWRAFPRQAWEPFAALPSHRPMSDTVRLRRCRFAHQPHTKTCAVVEPLSDGAVATRVVIADRVSCHDYACNSNRLWYSRSVFSTSAAGM